jgi:hypothetical protein
LLTSAEPAGSRNDDDVTLREESFESEERKGDRRRELDLEVKPFGV